MNKNATLSECSMGPVFALRNRLECEPIRSNPARNVHVSSLPDEAEEGTPLMDFVMSWANGFRLVAAMAAIALVIVTAGAM